MSIVTSVILDAMKSLEDMSSSSNEYAAMLANAGFEDVLQDKLQTTHSQHVEELTTSITLIYSSPYYHRHALLPHKTTETVCFVGRY